MHDGNGDEVGGAKENVGVKGYGWVGGATGAAWESLVVTRSSERRWSKASSDRGGGVRISGMKGGVALGSPNFS